MRNCQKVEGNRVVKNNVQQLYTGVWTERQRLDHTKYRFLQNVNLHLQTQWSLLLCLRLWLMLEAKIQAIKSYLWQSTQFFDQCRVQREFSFLSEKSVQERGQRMSCDWPYLTVITVLGGATSLGCTRVECVSVLSFVVHTVKRTANWSVNWATVSTHYLLSLYKS